MSLLDDAKRHSKKNPRGWATITDEHVDLALAYLRDDVTLGGIAKALELKPGGMTVYTTVARALHKAYRDGRIIIDRK